MKTPKRRVDENAKTVQTKKVKGQDEQRKNDHNKKLGGKTQESD